MTRAKLPTLSASLFQLGLAHVMARGSMFFATALLAHRLTTSEFGTVAFAQSLAFLATVFTDLGISTFAMREVARQRDAADKTVGAAYGLILALAGVASAVTVGLGFLFSDANVGLVIALFGMSTFAVGLYPNWAYKGRMRTGQYAAVESMRGPLYIVLLLVLVRGGHLYFVPLAYLVAYGVSSAVLWGLGREWLPRPTIDREAIRVVLTAAIPLSVAALAVQGTYYTGALFLEAFAGPRAVAAFVAPQKVTIAAYGLATVVGEVLLPRLTNALRESPDTAYALVRQSIRRLLGVSLLLLGASVFLAKPFLAAAFGSQYAGSALVQQLQLAALAVFTVGSPCVYLLLAIGAYRTLSIAGALGLAVNVAVSLALIPLLHSAGAAVATIATEATIAAAVVYGASQMNCAGIDGHGRIGALLWRTEGVGPAMVEELPKQGCLRGRAADLPSAEMCPPGG